jgi:hypothetical protein
MIEQVAGNWGKWRLPVYLVLGAFIAISAVVAWNFYAVRTAARWSVWSHSYKCEVLSQSPSASGQFKHVEWDGWG